MNTPAPGDDIANSTIIGMFWEGTGPNRVLKHKRRYADGRVVVETVGQEPDAVPFTERFKGETFAPHPLPTTQEPTTTDIIVKDLRKIVPKVTPTVIELANLMDQKPGDERGIVDARSMRLEAMLIRVCGGDLPHVKAQGVYFNGNQMGLDLVRLAMEAYGAPWNEAVESLHLGKRGN